MAKLKVTKGTDSKGRRKPYRRTKHVVRAGSIQFIDADEFECLRPGCAFKIVVTDGEISEGTIRAHLRKHGGR